MQICTESQIAIINAHIANDNQKSHIANYLKGCQMTIANYLKGCQTTISLFKRLSNDYITI
jgi:hypothetical protein